MEEHFRWHLSYFFSREFCIPHDPVATTKIDKHFGIGVVHWQSKPIPFDPLLIRQRFCKCLTKCNTGVFNGVMFVNLQIPFCLYGEIYFSMSCYLFQHVIKESKTCRNT